MTSPNFYTDIDIDAYRADFEQNADANYILIDVRETEEYGEGHVPGALNIPLSSLELHADDISREKPLVIICEKGSRSAMAAEFLYSLGYDELYNLIDGTFGWRRRGLPVERP